MRGQTGRPGYPRDTTIKIDPGAHEMKRYAFPGVGDRVFGAGHLERSRFDFDVAETEQLK